MELDTTVWMASMSKAAVSLAALVLVEQHGVSLDSNEALAEMLPELKLGNGGPVDMIFDGKDAQGQWKLRRAKVGITLDTYSYIRLGEFLRWNGCVRLRLMRLH